MTICHRSELSPDNDGKQYDLQKGMAGGGGTHKHHLLDHPRFYTVTRRAIDRLLPPLTGTVVTMKNSLLVNKHNLVLVPTTLPQETKTNNPR